MRRLAPLLALTALSGCATLPLATACPTALQAASTAQSVIELLERDWHLDHAKAVSWSSIILKGASGISLFCAAIPASPVVVPGQ